MEPIRKTRKITLQDIATQAGLSVSAVSLALRGHPAISDETRQRVLKISRDLGYKSTSRVGAFDGPRTPTSIVYSLLGESLQDDAYTPLAHGIIQGCRIWQAHLAIEHLTEGTPTRPVLMPTGVRPSGYIIAGYLTNEVVDFFTEGGVPVVVAGSHQLDRRVSTVRPDLVRATQMLIERALGDGHRHFVHLTSGFDVLHNQVVYEVMETMLRNHGIEITPDQVIKVSYHELHQPEVLERLSRLLDRKAAIVTTGDRMAETAATIFHAKEWMSRYGLDIYSLSSSDARKDGRHFYGLNMGMEEVGQVAVDRLIQRMLGYESCHEATDTLIPPPGWLPISKPRRQPAGTRQRVS